MGEVVLGIDIGTQGVRILAVDREGSVVAVSQAPLPSVWRSLPPGWREQSAADWWQVTQACLRELTGKLPAGTKIAGLSIDSTSGTIIAVDEAGTPLHMAIMYNDQRSEAQAAAAQAAGAAYQEKMGYVFGSSYGLPKILWLKIARPDVFERAACFLHAADFIVGRLTGNYHISDSSNALKTGYDLVDLCWPDYIEKDLGVPLKLLPDVSLPGAVMGRVSRHGAHETGLPVGTPVLAGATDGTAAQLASGAAHPGEWNSTLGTTLVVKGISRDLTLDPQGRVYYHRHPEGWWMPGGASNTGTEWIRSDHPNADLNQLNEQAAGLVPTDLVRYPLTKRGERFPFIHPGAVGFMLGQPQGENSVYAAGLEGLALMERLVYETLQQIGLEVGDRIYITGGGSKSLLWSKIRATVMNRILVEPVITETAMGAALLAASGVWFDSLSKASQAMVKVLREIAPEPAWQASYEARYAAFLQELQKRKYIP